MTRGVKIAISVAAALGLATGGSAGYSLANDYSKIFKDIQASSSATEAGSFAALQLKHADTVHAREAVLFSIRILERLNDAAPGEVQQLELLYAYTRLALVEEADGRQDAAEAAFDRARACYRRSHPDRPLATDEQLRNWVNKFDDMFERYRL